MENRKIKAVLFDMDGVLVDSEPVIQAAAIRTLKEYGVQARPEDFKPFVGAGDDRYIGGAAEKHGLEYREEMKNRLYDAYLELAGERLGLFPEAVPLLEKLKAEGYPAALATSADRIKVDANLGAAGIPESFFSCVITGEDVESKKPSPEIYLKSAEKLGVPAGACLVVEDALNGIEAGKRAGMLCAGISTSFSAAELENSGADFVLRRLGEVYGIIEDVNGSKPGE